MTRRHPLGDLYQKLFALKRENTALWNAQWGARMIHVPNSQPAQVFSFVRRNDRDKVFAVLNFSAEPCTVTFAEHLYPGTYIDYFSRETVSLDRATRLTVAPWGYRLFVR